ncbi:hypothetical protein CPC08DRAFT_101861 [Agrocybe pediades]|nr:hypothetical protein CPC08DRAFT_101861 [Agrocybe pediades]
MKFSTATFFVLFAAAASVLGQYDHNVDEMMAREFDFEEFEARGIEHELYVRQAEDVRLPFPQPPKKSGFELSWVVQLQITNVKRQLAQLERRSRAGCYESCVQKYSAGKNRNDCYTKCDKLWGKNGA